MDKDEAVAVAAESPRADSPKESPKEKSVAKNEESNPLGPTTSNIDEARVIIQRENGSGQREVTMAKYESLVREDSGWTVIHTNYVAPHHSDNA